MKTQTRDSILTFVTARERVSAKLIIAHVGLTPAAVFRQLAKLITLGLLKKQGVPPKVFYSLKRSVVVPLDYVFAHHIKQALTRQFLKIGTDGTLQQGVQAFVRWCVARGLEPVRAATDYVAVMEKYAAYKRDGLIDGTAKLRRTFPTTYLDRLLYLDFYSVERFGKTKLGELILYAKQSQNTRLIREILQEVRPSILRLIQAQQIDAVGFIPPTVRREVQFMKELEIGLNLPVRLIKIIKIKTQIAVPQKTLTKLADRIENAHETLVVEDEGSYQNVLLIDDAVGSGATIQEVAAQVRQKNLCRGALIGLSLVGSYSGFEVIHEV